MSEIADAVGTAAEGALVGDVLEPKAGSGRDSKPGADGHTRETACLNCGTELVGPHCYTCGQRGHVHRTLSAFLHDLLHGAFHFEGKIWHTLPLLAWRPGELTRRYIEGERARFVSPMALFLFSVFLMFAVFQVVGIGPPSDLGPPVQFDMGNNPPDREGQLRGLQVARARLADDNPAATVLDRQIDRLEGQVAEREAPATPAIVDGPTVRVERTGDVDLSTLETGWKPLDQGIKKWRENPSLMAYKLQANSYKFSWLLIPLSIPFVWLLFAWRRRFGAYDHAVFVTYSLAFMTLLFIAVALVGQVPGTATFLFFATTLIPPVHIYKQLKGAYGLSRFSAGWRTFALMFMIFWILFLFVDLLLVLGVVG